MLELASLIWVGSRIGVLLTLLLLAAGVVVGMAVIRKSGMGLAAVLRRAASVGQFTKSDAGHLLLWTAAGFLFALPGFVSDAAAIFVLTPPVTRWLANRLVSGVHAEYMYARGNSRPGGTIIEGDAVEIGSKIAEPGENRN